MKPRKREPLVNRIAAIGDYLPCQCGIATFTTDLCEAIAAAFPETSCFALAVNDMEADLITEYRAALIPWLAFPRYRDSSSLA